MTITRFPSTISFDDVQGFMEQLVARTLDADYPTFVARGLALAELFLDLPPERPGQDDGTTMRRSMVFCLLRAIWKQTPHPGNRFAPLPLPPVERNGPCFCGSQRKYKACCLPAEQAVRLDGMNLLPIVLDALPRKRWAELAGSRVGVEMLAATAFDWNREGRAKEVRALLEPWLAKDDDLVARREPLFDALLDAYGALGMPRKKARLLERALAAGDRTIRSAAMQRRVSMLADAGDYTAAWALFREAQRHEPESPSLAHLEVTVLISQGRDAEARERARFWALRLGARRDPDLQSLIGLLRDIAEHGGGALGKAVAAMDPALGEMTALFETAPAPASHYTLSPQDGSAGPLEPAPTLRKALAAWDEACPPLDHSPMGDDLSQLRRELAPQWLPVLRRYPMLWNAFDVLDALVDVVTTYDSVGVLEGLVVPLLDRAERVLDAVLAANRAEHLKLEWGWLQNRPALSLLGERARADFDGDATPACIARLERLVLRLNPNDNQGFRGELGIRYIEAGRIDDAIALAERYPRDYAGMRYNRVLALFAAGRRGDALTALRDAEDAYPRPAAWLLKANPRPPRENGPGLRVGGEEEAWRYRERALAQWRRLGALDWLHVASSAVRKR